MKIALIGYGKMGKEIEQIALSCGHEIVLKIDVNNPDDFTDENLRKADVAIEFSAPSVAFNNFSKVLRAGVPVVVGTTGWSERLPEVTQLVKDFNGRFFHASNYSVGVNLFMKVNKYLASLMDGFPDYEVSMLEVHHTQKLDAPSGTAITLAEGIIQNIQRLNKWELAKSGDSSSLRIDYIRQYKVTGTHTVHYENDVDCIEITHTAKSRRGFAAGAVKAAEFLIKQNPGMYSMEDLLG